MKRLSKKNLMAVALSLCVAVVADPVLQIGLIENNIPTEKQESLEVGIVLPDEVVEIISKLPASKNEVLNSPIEEKIESVEFVPVATPEESDADDNDSDEKNEDTEAIADEEGKEDTETPEQDEEPADLTFEEKKDIIFNELLQNGCYSFEWYGTEISLTYDEFVYLCKLVHRETMGEDLEGRIMVVDVIFNRVNYCYYPNDVISVINQPYQFSPVTNNTVLTAVPDTITIDAVLYAMAGLDYSQGALYFKMTGYYSIWFEDLQELFSHGCHSFYR